MATPLVIIVTMCYFGTALDQILEGHHWWALVWACYGLANFGLLKTMP